MKKSAFVLTLILIVLGTTGALAAPVREGFASHAHFGNASVSGRIAVQYVAVPQWLPSPASLAPLRCNDIVVSASLSSGRSFSTHAVGDISSGSCEYRVGVNVPAGSAERALMDWAVPVDKGKAIKSSPIVLDVLAGQTQRVDFGALVGLCAHPNKM